MARRADNGPVTVRQLIELLETLPGQDLPTLIQGYEMGYEYASKINLVMVGLDENPPEECWHGPHEEYGKTRAYAILRADSEDCEFEDEWQLVDFTSDYTVFVGGREATMEDVASAGRVTLRGTIPPPFGFVITCAPLVGGDGDD